MTVHPKTKINAAICTTIILAVAGWYFSDRREISSAIAEIKDDQSSAELANEKRLTAIEERYTTIDDRLKKIEARTESIYYATVKEEKETKYNPLYDKPAE